MLFITLQAAGQAGNYASLLMMLVIFAIFYFFFIRPQVSKQKEQVSFQTNMKNWMKERLR
jgi:preprotein translocase subunit YajC